MYIKGGSVVDGNFYIEGGLRVNSIRDAEGSTFISIKDYTPSRLVMFSETETNKLVSTGISETTTDTKASLLTAVNGYCSLEPLRTKDSTISGVSFFDENYNPISSSLDAKYRTLTSDEKTNLTAIDDSRIIPDAWAYVG